MKTIINENIARLRAYFNMTKTQFARLLSTSQPNITQLEQGPHQPSARFIATLRQVLPMLNMKWFYGEVDQPMFTSEPPQFEVTGKRQQKDKVTNPTPATELLSPAPVPLSRDKMTFSNSDVAATYYQLEIQKLESMNATLKESLAMAQRQLALLEQIIAQQLLTGTASTSTAAPNAPGKRKAKSAA